MEEFFMFLETHQVGILILIAILAAVVLLVQWLAWIFSVGRFGAKNPTPSDLSLRYIVSQFLVNVIDDFRHLLALIIVIIFALVLGYAIIQAGNEFDKITAALQTVVATLGAIIGSILGYYFGESAATKSLAQEQIPTPVGEPELPAGEDVEGIKDAPTPPAAPATDSGA